MIDRAHLEAKRGEHTHYVVPATGEKRCCLCLSIWPCEQSQILDLALSAEDKTSELRFIEQLAHDVYSDELANNYGGLGYELRPAGLAVAEVMRTAEGYRKALERIAYEDALVYMGCSDIPACNGSPHAADCVVGVARAALEETR